MLYRLVSSGFRRFRKKYGINETITSYIEKQIGSEQSKNIIFCDQSHFSDFDDAIQRSLCESLAGVVLRTISPDEYIQRQDFLISKIIEIDSMLFSVLTWSDLFIASMRMGHFRLGLLARKKIKEHMYASKEKSSLACLAALAVEDGNLTLIEEVLDKNKFFKDNRVILTVADYENNLHLNNISSNIRNNPYYDFINGSKIALVGPGVNEFNNGRIIDNFDRVVILGYRGNEGRADPSVSGSRVDASYYGNGSASKFLNSEIVEKLGDELKFASFKTGKNRKLFKKYSVNTRVFFRNTFVNGSPMMAQNAIFDILLHNPANLTIFNTDLYSSSKTHHSTYTDVSTYKINKGNKLWPFHAFGTAGFSHHDIFSNFIYTKNKFLKNTIAVDKGLNDVLVLSIDEYAVKLEEVHIIPYL